LAEECWWRRENSLGSSIITGELKQQSIADAMLGALKLKAFTNDVTTTSHSRRCTHRVLEGQRDGHCHTMAQLDIDAWQIGRGANPSCGYSTQGTAFDGCWNDLSFVEK
jgi:collagenase-like PrtC family protease